MKKLIFSSMIFFLVYSVWSQEEPAGLRRYAIFAGSNNGGDERVHLIYAETDAKAMYEVLAEIGGLSPSDTILLTDPDIDEIRQAFTTIQTSIARDKEKNRRSEFIFYYSGHSDESGILPGGDLFEYSELRNEIDKMNTEVKIAVLDSCSSGSFTRLKGGVKKAPFLIDESSDTKGHAFLTSSSENEAAQESDSIEGSFFTHYLITALRGAADSTQDGTVTLTEAYSFAADETLARTTSSIAGAQHPSYSINLTGSGDLVLTDLREIVSSISIDKEIDGRIFFRDSSDRLVIEFRKRAGIPVAISLPGGVYSVDLETDRGLSSTVITISRGDVRLANEAFAPVERSFARVRGGEIEPESSVESDLEKRMSEIRAEINNRVYEEEDLDWNIPVPGIDLDNGVYEDTDAELDEVERSLEKKMEEIRGILDDKFGKGKTSENETPSEDIIVLQQPVLEHKLIGIGFTPTSGSSDDVVNFSVGFIPKPFAVYGLSAGFMTMTHQDAYGVQIGALSNQSGRDNYGVQVSSIYNIVNRNLWGASLSGVFNLTNGTVHGLQGAGVFNISSYKLIGVQASAVFNITKNFSYGAQAAAVFNITNGTMAGLQAAGIFNIADGYLHGLQAAGIFNVAQNINGIQAGLINVGGIVNGMQIGLININEDINGLPLGLITISKNGIMDFGGWYENSGFFYTGIQTGSKNFYNFAYVAFPTNAPESVLAAGIGVGARINLRAFYFDLDASVKNVAVGNDYGAAIKHTFTADVLNSIYPNARISAGLKLFKVLTIYGGMSLDMHLPGITNRSEYFHNSDEPLVIHNLENGDGILEIHPKWFGGLKINL